VASPVSLAEQAKPLPPLVREVIPVSSSLELVFLVISFLGLLLAGAGIVLVRGMVPPRSQVPLSPPRDAAESADPLAISKAHRLSDSVPGYDVIHDKTYLRRIQEADDPTRLRRSR
jgi:hypothetical protein